MSVLVVTMIAKQKFGCDESHPDVQVLLQQGSRKQADSIAMMITREQFCGNEGYANQQTDCDDDHEQASRSTAIKLHECNNQPAIAKTFVSASNCIDRGQGNSCD